MAGPDRVALLFGSRHINPTSEFEELNPGVFAVWDAERTNWPVDISLGAFRNSYGRGSVAALAAWPVWQGNNAELSLFGGLAHYPEDGRRFLVSLGDVVPLGGVQLRAGPVVTQLIPGDGEVTDATLTFGLTFALPGQ